MHEINANTAYIVLHKLKFAAADTNEKFRIVPHKS